MIFFHSQKARLRSTRRPHVGVVCPSRNGSWLGGLHFVEHLLRALGALPEAERVPWRDVWWDERLPADDPFADVRGPANRPALVGMPSSVGARLRRRLYRLWHGYAGLTATDLFHREEIGVLFPGPPCDRAGMPVVGVCYDFQYHHLPEFYTEQQRRDFADRDRQMAESATLVLVISQATLNDLRRFLPELAHKARLVRVHSVPAAEWWTADPAATARRYDLPPRFFLLPNQVCAHKNHTTVFAALHRLRSGGRNLCVVCTGRTEDYRDPTFFGRLAAGVRERGLEGVVRFLGAVPRAEYVALARQSLAVVQPSLFEGWGFALSDAQALGKPVLVSDLPVHHEHGCQVRAYLPPLEVDAWASALDDANRELQPGPDLAVEAAARAAAEDNQRRLGREFAAILREAMSLGPISAAKGGD